MKVVCAISTRDILLDLQNKVAFNFQISQVKAMLIKCHTDPLSQESQATFQILVVLAPLPHPKSNSCSSYITKQLLRGSKPSTEDTICSALLISTLKYMLLANKISSSDNSLPWTFASYSCQ